MYKEYPTFKPEEILEYGRKSQFDDPLLTVEEQLEKHEKILDEYAIRHFGGSIPAANKYKEISRDKKTGLESLQFPIYCGLREIGKEPSYD